MGAWASDPALPMMGNSATVEVSATHATIPAGGAHAGPRDPRTIDELANTPNAVSLTFRLAQFPLLAQEAAIAPEMSLGPVTIVGAAVFPQALDHHGPAAGPATSFDADVLSVQLIQDEGRNNNAFKMNISVVHRFVAPVPEPSGLALVGIGVGMLGIGWCTHRRRAPAPA